MARTHTHTPDIIFVQSTAPVLVAESNADPESGSECTSPASTVACSQWADSVDDFSDSDLSPCLLRADPYVLDDPLVDSLSQHDDSPDWPVITEAQEIPGVLELYDDGPLTPV